MNLKNIITHTQGHKCGGGGGTPPQKYVLVGLQVSAVGLKI